MLVALQTCSLAALWWLTRLALGPSHVGWGAVATAQLAGNAASKVVPGGPATGGVVQAKLFIQAGQPPAAVARR